MPPLNEKLGIKVNVNVPQPGPLTRPINLAPSRRIAAGQVTPIVSPRPSPGGQLASGALAGIGESFKKAFEEETDPTIKLKKEIEQKEIQSRLMDLDEKINDPNREIKRQVANKKLNLMDQQLTGQLNAVDKEAEIKAQKDKNILDELNLKQQQNEQVLAQFTESKAQQEQKIREKGLIPAIFNKLSANKDEEGNISFETPEDSAFRFSFEKVPPERLQNILKDINLKEPQMLENIAGALDISRPAVPRPGSRVIVTEDNRVIQEDRAFEEITPEEQKVRRQALEQELDFVDFLRTRGYEAVLGEDGKIKSASPIEAGSPNSIRMQLEQTPEHQKRAITSGVPVFSRKYSDEKEKRNVAKETNDFVFELEAELRGAEKTLAEIVRFVDLNTNVETGGWKNNMANAIARGVHASPTLVEMAQIVDKLTPQMRQGLPGAASNFEVAMFRNATVGIDKPLEVNQSIMRGQLTMIDRVRDQLHFIDEYTKLHGSSAGALGEWRAYTRANPVYAKDATSENLKLNENAVHWSNWFRQKSLPNVSEQKDLLNIPVGEYYWDARKKKTLQRESD